MRKPFNFEAKKQISPAVSTGWPGGGGGGGGGGVSKFDHVISRDKRWEIFT